MKTVALPCWFLQQSARVESGRAREFARLPANESDYIEQTGVPSLYGEAGFTPTSGPGRALRWM